MVEWALLWFANCRANAPGFSYNGIVMPILSDIINGWELVLLVAVIVILLGAKHLRGLARGLGEGFSHFRKSVDREAHAAGESLGGIYGKPAAQALTPDNHTAELYDPAVFQREERRRRIRRHIRFRSLLRTCQSIWRSGLRRLKTKK